MIDRTNIKYHWDLVQGSDEWREIRLGKFTGSNAAPVLTDPNKFERVKLIAQWIHSEPSSNAVVEKICAEFGISATTAKKYLKTAVDFEKSPPSQNEIDEGMIGAGIKTLIYKKASELITGDEGDSFHGNIHTDRGNASEPLAIELYEEATWSTVKKCGFIELNHYIGYSPDGLIGEDGIAECKAPDNAEYLRLLFEQTIDPKYFAQMMFGLWVTGRKWCDNIYFNSSFGNMPYFHIRFERDEKVMQIFDEKMGVIIRKMDEILNKYHDKK